MMTPPGAAIELLKNPNAIELANTPNAPSEGQVRTSLQQQGKRLELRNQELSAQSAAKIMDFARRQSMDADTPEHKASVMLDVATAELQKMAGVGQAKMDLAGMGGGVEAIMRRIYS